MRTITTRRITITKTRRRAIILHSVLMLGMLGTIMYSLTVPAAQAESGHKNTRMNMRRATPAEVLQQRRDRLLETMMLEAERRERLLADTAENCRTRMGGQHQRPC